MGALMCTYDDPGDLILEDPRGFLPPFGNRVIHSPAGGDVVLFPSWLVHHVSPSCGTNEVSTWGGRTIR